MGIFDSLSKIAKSVDSIADAAKKLSDVDPSKAMERIEKAAKSFAGNASGDSGEASRTASSAAAKSEAVKAAKPSVKREYDTYHYTEDDKYTVKASFMLSGDFVQSESSAAEIEAIYPYAPDYVDPEGEDFLPEGEWDGNPYFMVSCDINEVYVSVNEYLESGTVKKAQSVCPANKGDMLFRAEFSYYGKILVCYCFKSEKRDSPCGLCMVYDKSVKNTALEKKLLAALDEAAETFEERLEEVK